MQIINFLATDGIELTGILYNIPQKTQDVILSVHGMSSNCFKKREEVIAKKANENNIDYFCFNNRGSELAKYIRKNINGKREKLNTPDKPMLKIGGGSGFLATTIGLKIKEHDDYNFDDYFEKVRNITRGKSYDYCFPKSRKVTFKGGYPLGWVQISFN